MTFNPDPTQVEIVGPALDQANYGRPLVGAVLLTLATYLAYRHGKDQPAS